MDRFNALGRGAQIMLVAGVLLFIDLFLTWQDFDVGDLGKFNGWEGFLGVLLGILTIALIAWFVLRLVAPQVRLPFSQALASAALGAAIVLVGLLKLLSVIDDEATIFAYIGFILAVLVGVGAWMVVQGAGGIETLKAELPSMETSSTLEEPPPTVTPPTTTPPAAPSETAPAPPPAEPAPPETAPERPYEPEPPAEREPDEPDRPRDV